MEIIGWTGMCLVIIAYYPQIRHLYVERCAWGISMLTWVLWLAASVFLLIYAMFERDSLFVVVQAVNLMAIATTLVLAMKSNSTCPFHSGVATNGGGRS